ncbi:hypothetical protein ANO11243_003250 [Dothideomycetidae sp. 11243]|nr:hypothetical protein ANO11243_003250 [fungal sp. No.11243]
MDFLPQFEYTDLEMQELLLQEQEQHGVGTRFHDPSPNWLTDPIYDNINVALNSSKSIKAKPRASRQKKPYAAAASPNRRSKGGRKTEGRMKIAAPLSELTKDSEIPIRDIESWVNRPAHERVAETDKRNGFVSRPMNSFMLYRSAYAERTKGWCRENNHQIVSEIVGKSWPLESDELRAQFNAWALIEKDNHAAAFPNYKFSPRKPGTKKVVDLEIIDESDQADEEYTPSRSSSSRRVKPTVTIPRQSSRHVQSLPQAFTVADYDPNFPYYVLDAAATEIYAQRQRAPQQWAGPSQETPYFAGPAGVVGPQDPSGQYEPLPYHAGDNVNYIYGEPSGAYRSGYQQGYTQPPYGSQGFMSNVEYGRTDGGFSSHVDPTLLSIDPRLTNLNLDDAYDMDLERQRNME